MTIFTMRPAMKSEFPAAIDLYQECWKDQRLIHEPNWSANDDLTERSFRKGSFNRYGVHIINVNQQDIGLFAVHVTEEEIWPRDLCLLPDYRNLGIGTHIIGLLKEQATNANIAVRLETEKRNVGAQKLYREQGFIQVAESDDNITMRWWPDNIRPA